jgi:hypothetical protein
MVYLVLPHFIDDLSFNANYFSHIIRERILNLFTAALDDYNSLHFTNAKNFRSYSFKDF